MTWTVHNGDCITGLAGLDQGSVDLIFADPPYNIGIDYGDGPRADRRPSVEYIAWMQDWINAAALALSPTGSLWIVCGQEHGADHDHAIQAAGLTIRSRITWYETFGNNCRKKFNRTSRPIFYAVKDDRHFTFNRDAVTTPSARQTKYRDRRAAAGGKILDDVWKIPRVCGTHSARVDGVPTQIPEEILRRVVLCSSNPDDLVVDPFTGSGTTGVVSVKNGRRFVGWELREQFAAIARSRIESAAGLASKNTTVWNRAKGSPTLPTDAVHIGRHNRFPPIKASPFLNPWPCDPNDDQERAAVVAKFGRWLFEDADLIAEKGKPPSLEDVRTLAGKPLVCWCVPKLCHGHILAAVADGLIVDRDDLERWIASHRPP